MHRILYFCSYSVRHARSVGTRFNNVIECFIGYIFIGFWPHRIVSCAQCTYEKNRKIFRSVEFFSDRMSTFYNQDFQSCSPSKNEKKTIYIVIYALRKNEVSNFHKFQNIIS